MRRVPKVSWEQAQWTPRVKPPTFSSSSFRCRLWTSSLSSSSRIFWNTLRSVSEAVDPAGATP